VGSASGVNRAENRPAIPEGPVCKRPARPRLSAQAFASAPDDPESDESAFLLFGQWIPERTEPSALAIHYPRSTAFEEPSLIFLFHRQFSYARRMTEIELLLAQKESARQQLKRQIEALRRSAALLAEPPSAQPEIPALVAAISEQPARSEIAPMLDRTPAPKAAAASGVPNFVRFASPAQVFPPANEGVIVCDGCGHRNPDFLLDCERCDLPIRLRP
jgi:hypothetical protein